MYRNFYGFKEKPFELTPDPYFIYLSEIHQEALAYLRYAIREGKGFSVITGEAGTGKTSLVHMLLSRLDGRIRTCYIFNPILDPVDFLNYICEDLGIELGAVRSRGQSLSALHHFLLDCYTRDEKVFLIIDEAQSLEPKLLQQVRLLTNLETSKNKLLHVILLGQPELNETLEKPHFRPLKQRISVRFDLRPLNLSETRDYIVHRIKKAGARSINIFDTGAIKEIYGYSRGIPRLINIICDNALLTGFSLDQNRIGKKIIRDVVKELEGGKRKHKSKFWRIVILLFLLAVILAIFLHEWGLRQWELLPTWR